MTVPLNEAQLQEALAASPFCAFLNLDVVSADAQRQEVIMKMPFRPEFERSPGTGQFHGGPIAALVDTVGDYAIGMMVGRGVPTINFRVDYLRPAVDTSLTAVARVRRSGKTIAVVDIDVFDDQERLLAVGRGTYSSKTG